jgi:CheY-like chemotaxis protein
MAKALILIVDDNAMNTKLLSFVLEAAGHDVRSAANAAEAVGILENGTPHLILMDLQLPGVSGLELTRRLKNDPRTSRTPIVAMTAYATIGDEAKARAAGCDGYLTKPIDTHALPQLIAKYLP